MRSHPRSTLTLTAAAVVVAGCGGSATAARTTPSPAPSLAVTDGPSLIAAMRQRYAGKWYTTLSFLQNNTLYSLRGTETKSQWMEYMSIPGKLRIDYLPLENHSGVLYAGGTVYSFDNGRLASSQAGINPYLLLSADVYARPAEETARLADSLGFKVGLFHTDAWEGRPAYVLGAPAGDTTASQFWVDVDRLLVVRVRQLERRGDRTIVTEARFNKYADFGGYPVSTEVLLYRDGRLVFKEEYANVKVNPPLSADLFDPAKWVEAQPKAN